MLDQINTQLKKAVRDLRVQKKLHYRLERTKASLEEALEDFHHAEERLEAEFRDVKMLEKHTVQSAFLNLVGKRMERLSKERREFEEVLHERDYLAYQIEQYQKEILRIEPQLASLEEKEAAVSLMMKTKEDYLVAFTNSQDREKLLIYQEKIQLVEDDIWDLIEAIKSGYQYEKCLRRLLGFETSSAIFKRRKRIEKIEPLYGAGHDFENDLEDVIQNIKLKVPLTAKMIDAFLTNLDFYLFHFDFSTTQKAGYILQHLRLVEKSGRIMEIHLRGLKKSRAHLLERKDHLVRGAE